MRVCNLTTPANYFHALRRQLNRNFRKPLMIFDAEVAAAPQAGGLAAGGFRERQRASSIVIPEIDAIAPPEKVRRVVICSGKVYYDLLAERRDEDIKDVAILRLEQFYPFPENTLGRLLAPYHNADVVWCQEEPENMGAWNFVDRRIEKVLGRPGHASATRPVYVGREAAASPATGRQDHGRAGALVHTR